MTYALHPFTLPVQDTDVPCLGFVVHTRSTFFLEAGDARRMAEEILAIDFTAAPAAKVGPAVTVVAS